jgi:hypothetical protein
MTCLAAMCVQSSRPGIAFTDLSLEAQNQKTTIKRQRR